MCSELSSSFLSPSRYLFSFRTASSFSSWACLNLFKASKNIALGLTILYIDWIFTAATVRCLTSSFTNYLALCPFAKLAMSTLELCCFRYFLSCLTFLANKNFFRAFYIIIDLLVICHLSIIIYLFITVWFMCPCNRALTYSRAFSYFNLFTSFIAKYRRKQFWILIACMFSEKTKSPSSTSDLSIKFLTFLKPRDINRILFHLFDVR